MSKEINEESLKFVLDTILKTYIDGVSYEY